MTDLSDKKCVPCEGGVPNLTPPECKGFLARLKNWHINTDYTEINKEFNFKNFHETMSFVNAIAWIAHQENHHPDLAVGYNYCKVRYSTHAINGLSENDFICAAKVDALIS